MGIPQDVGDVEGCSVALSLRFIILQNVENGFARFYKVQVETRIWRTKHSNVRKSSLHELRLSEGAAQFLVETVHLAVLAVSVRMQHLQIMYL